jgi:hypothetical protein
VGNDPTYGFPFWKVAVIVASLVAAGIVAGIVTCLVRNKRLRRELSEWKRGKEEQMVVNKDLKK